MSPARNVKSLRASGAAALPAAAPRVLHSVVEAIGRTPLVRVRLDGVPEAVEIWAKCEFFNPGGSVKDRTALALIEDGEQRGALAPGKVITDSSSGNTAVGLALVGRAKGYSVELVMPANVSADRQRLCRAYGATLVFTDAFEGSDGAIVSVRERVARAPERYFYADQYRNPANPLAHYHGTGPEVWGQTEGRVTHFVAGLGTSGTLMGTGRYLRERNPRVRLLAVQPDEALHGLEGLKHMPSALVPEIYDTRGHDDVVPVATEEAHELCAMLTETHGLFVGHSAGAALVAARRVACELRAGVVVALLPDGGERYLHPTGEGRPTPEFARTEHAA
jgi:cysteine synthase B